ncbi:MAG: hypothetical protein ACOYOS_17585 [Syntrophales bacterium]
MAFLLFERALVDGRPVINPTKNTFSLAGYNLIYRAWLAHGSPVDEGWHVTADELIQLHSDGAHDYSSRCLVIDFDPTSTRRIGLIELLDVYAFTWSDGNGGPSWTPLMLRLRDVHYEEYDPPIDQNRKAEILSNLPEQAPDSRDFVEFLYINGPLYSWNWGKNGMTNAVFLQGAARDYFRKFF